METITAHTRGGNYDVRAFVATITNTNSGDWASFESRTLRD